MSKNEYNLEFVQKYKCGFCVNLENEEEMTNVILTIIEHCENARKMGLNGRRAIKEYYNWDLEEKKLVSLYEKLLEGAYH